MLVTIPECELLFEVDYKEDRSFGDVMEILRVTGDDMYGLDFGRLFIASGIFPNVKYISLYDAIMDAARAKYAEENPRANEYADERLNKEQLGLK